MSETIISPSFNPKRKQMELTEADKIQREKMEEFCEVFKTDFNQSQIEVLHKVKDMPLDDILLIQGPVSEI